MIDIKLVRTSIDEVKSALARKGVPAEQVDEVARLDSESRRLVQAQEEARARVKDLSRQVADAKRGGDDGRAQQLAAESRTLSDEQKDMARGSAQAEAALRNAMLVLPNLPDAAAADGESEADNPIVRSGGPEPGAGDKGSRPHWEIGAELALLDLERGAKLSGSMFPVYRGDGARLGRALIHWFLDEAGDAKTIQIEGDPHLGAPWEEIRPPSFVLTETLTATGHLPKFADDAYHIERDDLWAIPTAEVPLTSLARDEILAESDLPARMAAYTPCFRREAGSAGKDTRGLLRVHEFDKVELLAYATPDQAQALFMEILSRAESLASRLGLSWRIKEICTGDLGQSHARSFDLEAYAPGCDQWLEISSVSWFSDYQARRANVRYRPSGGGPPAFVHTVNGSALAIPRTWAALVETHLQPDGTIAVPEPLQPYLRKDTLGRPT